MTSLAVLSRKVEVVERIGALPKNDVKLYVQLHTFSRT